MASVTLTVGGGFVGSKLWYSGERQTTIYRRHLDLECRWLDLVRRAITHSTAERSVNHGDTFISWGGKLWSYMFNGSRIIYWCLLTFDLENGILAIMLDQRGTPFCTTLRATLTFLSIPHRGTFQCGCMGQKPWVSGLRTPSLADALMFSPPWWSPSLCMFSVEGTKLKHTEVVQEQY